MSEDRVLERDPSNIEQEESLEDIRLEAMLSDPKRREEILRRIREKEECHQQVAGLLIHQRHIGQALSHPFQMRGRYIRFPLGEEGVDRRDGG